MANDTKQRRRRAPNKTQEQPLLDLREVPPALLARGIAAVEDSWEGILFIAQSAGDRKWRVWSCFGEELDVVSDLYSTANECWPTYLARMILIRSCAHHFYEAGRRSAMPIPLEPGSRPTLTLV